jgi:hypothetical protein
MARWLPCVQLRGGSAGLSGDATLLHELTCVKKQTTCLTKNVRRATNEGELYRHRTAKWSSRRIAHICWWGLSSRFEHIVQHFNIQLQDKGYCSRCCSG